MSKQTFSWERFSRVPLVGIIRHIAFEDVVEILGIYKEAGLSTVEITMNTPGATALIRVAIKELGSVVNIGAGTVCNAGDLDLALAAGAQCSVAPVKNEEVIVPYVQKKI